MTLAGGVLYFGRYHKECPCTSDTRGYDLVVSFTSKRAPSGNPFCFICQKPDVMNDSGSMKYCESVLRLNTHLKRVQYYLYQQERKIRLMMKIYTRLLFVSLVVIGLYCSDASFGRGGESTGLLTMNISGDIV